MRGSVKQASNGTWTVVYDAGDQPRHECMKCGWMRWAGSQRAPRRCPDCSGENVHRVMARRQIRKRGFRTKGDGEAWVAAQINAVTSGRHVDPTKLTLQSYIDETWLPHRVATRSPNTSKKDEEIMRINVLPYLGDKLLQKLEAHQVQDLLNQLKTSGGALGKGLKAKSRHHVYATLNKALNDAVDRGLVATNIMRRVETPVVPKGHMRVWTPSQMLAFIDRFAEHWLFAAWMLVMTTGMRRGEIMGLRWCDIDWTTNTLRVEWSFTDAGPRWIYKDPKSHPRARRNTSRRTLAADPRTMLALRNHKKIQMEQRLAAGEDWIDDLYPFFEFPDGVPDNLDLVFRKPDGSPVKPRYLSDNLPKLAKAARLPHMTPHGLRHSYATMLVADGTHMKQVSERLGHSTIGQTYDTYGWILPSVDEATAAHGAELLFTANERARWVRRCAGCREVDDTVRYASESDAALHPDWRCPDCGAAVAELIEVERPDTSSGEGS